MERTRSRGAAAVALALVSVALLGLAGCGGGSGSDSGSGSGSGSDADVPTTGDGVTVVPTAADFSQAGTIVIAHRGASGVAPEHTFAAYDRAFEMGATYLEHDLQLTADGELVILHDPTLDRTLRGPAETCSGPVGDRTLMEIQSCDAGTWFNEAYPERADPAYVGLNVPTLEEVFERYLTDLSYYIEVKAPEEQPGVEDALLELLDRTDLDPTIPGVPRIVIQSFSADSLRRIHGRRPDLPLVQLVSAAAPVPDGGALDEIATYAVAIAPAKGMVDAELVAAASERCLAVHPYTVNEPVEMTALLDAGVRGMFSDVPDELLAIRADRPTPAELCAAASTSSN